MNTQPNTEKTPQPAAESEIAPRQRYRLSVDDNFHFMDETERSSAGTFETYEEAVAAAQQAVDRSLRWERRQCRDPHDPVELYDRYTDFGDDPFVRPEPEGRHFSAWGYAKERCREICDEPVEKGGART